MSVQSPFIRLSRNANPEITKVSEVNAEFSLLFGCYLTFPPWM